MRKLYIMFVILSTLFSATNIIAQVASVTWPLTSTQNPNTPIGNIQASPETIGAGSGSYILSIYNPYVANGQRLWTGNQGTGWIAGLPDYTRYIQFDASPTAGNNFTVQYLAFQYSDNPLNTDFNIIKGEVWYSTNGWNNKTQLTTSPLNYMNTSVQTFSKSMSVLVQNGQTFSVRIYPYTLNGGLAMTPSFATHRNLIIEGVTSAAVVNNASICGVKFNDLNGNGSMDMGEPGLANWTINLSGASTASVTTDATGNFCFNNLAAGIYTVAEVQQQGWTQTAPTPDTYTITLTAGQSRSDINFGNKVNASVGCVDPPGGMVAWWSLDETSGTISNDLAGLNNAGTQINGPVPVAGKVLSGLQFDGINDYIEVPNHSELDFGTGNFSIDAWVRTNQLTGQLTIVNKIQFPLNRGYSLYLSNGEVRLILSASSYMFYVSSVNVADGDWHHIAVTVDRNDPSGIKFYKDGIMLSSSDPTTNPGTITAISPLRIGSLSWVAGDLFKGTLDEIELFNRVLTPQEINSIYTAGSAGKCKLTLQLGSICGVKFNDINGNGIKDTGEPGIANWTINLSGASISTTTTDANGDYCFNNLAAGTYSISETNQSGWQQTYPSTPGSHTIILLAGQNASGINFGNKSLSSSQNDACLTWSLLGSTAVTSTSGNIIGQPEILGPGSSAPLMAIFPPYTSNGQRLLVTGGWPAGSMDVTRYIEFNASPASGNNFIVNNISFSYGDNPLTQNFNILNGNVYYSTNNWSSPGTQIGSTLIYLNTTMQTFVASNLNVSVSNGQTFSLRIYPYSPTGSIAGTVSLAIHNYVTICGSTNTAVVNTGSICGMKFNDLNGNGVKETGEPGLPNWIINLTGSSTATATTDATGNFCFNNLPPGTYNVSEVQQSGWTQTAPTTNTYTLTLTAGQSRSDILFGNKLNAATGCVPPPSGMVAWYPLDEALGATVVSDIMGTNNGTPVPGPIGNLGSGLVGPAPGSTLSFLSPRYKVNGSMFFYADATVKYVRVPDAPSLNFGAGDFSIDAWVYPVVGSIYVQPIVDKVVTTVSYCIGYRLFIHNGQLNFVVMDGNNVSTTTAPITYSQWQHIAAVRKGGSPNSFLLYINGVLVTTTSAQINNTNNTANLLIGGITNPSGGTLCGVPAQFNYGEIAIDELEIFNRALTQPEIFSIWHADTFGKCKLTSNVKELEKIPAKFEMFQCYPNPFNPTTTIRYDVPQSGFVKISVYDILGKEISVLVNEEKSPGIYEAKFDAEYLSSGVYFYTIRTGEFTQSKKMILMK